MFVEGYMYCWYIIIIIMIFVDVNDLFKIEMSKVVIMKFLDLKFFCRVVCFV